MTDEAEALHIRPPEPIVVSVLRARNLRGSKGDNLQCFVKVEFGDRTLGESSKQECIPESPAEFNFSANIMFSFDDPISLDEILQKPVVVTVYEVLTKEKKSKEEKSVILGQCCIDLLPLVQGSVEISRSLQLSGVTESPADTVPFNEPKGEIDIRVAVSEPLFDEFQISEGNMLTISVGSLYSPPESWMITGVNHSYGVALPVPLTADKELPVLFANGKLKSPQEKEGPKKQKRWAVPGTAIGNAVFMPDRFMFSDPVENEDGDFKGKDDLEHRKFSEQERNRVTWNMERRFYLQRSALKNFQDTITKNYYWPVEVIRLPHTSTTKGKKEEESSLAFHGLALINLSSLLYPGVSRVKGAFRVIGFSETVLAEKTKRQGGVVEDAVKFSSTSPHKYSAASTHRKLTKNMDNKDSKKTNQLRSDTALDVDTMTAITAEGQQYTDAKSYIMIEFCLDKPLIPKRTTEALIKRVAELIPPRPLYPKRTDRAQKAVEDYHAQVAIIAEIVLDNFRDMFADELKDSGPQSPDVMEQRRQQFVYELNTTGKYFAIKEQLKHSVVKIVREKYLRTTNFEDKGELQTFLSELYVYLVDQMHVSLSKVLAYEDQPAVPKPLKDSNQLKHFAFEAEINHNFELAETYYKERIARNKADTDSWFDYGTFNLYIGNIPKAEECFKECLSTNPKHLQSLLVYGIVCVISDKNEIAETFFETATCIHCKSVLAWTMLGLFYDAVSNEIGAEMAYAEANRLNDKKILAFTQAMREKEEELQEQKRKEQEKIAGESKREEILMAVDEGGLSVQAVDPKLGNIQKSTPALAKQISPAIRQAPSVSPSTLSRPSGKPGSEEPIQHDLTSVLPSSIFMEAVDWLLQVKAISFTERALGHELLTITGGPKLDFYIAMAKLYILKGDYSEAENNLNEALQLDIKNQDTWALMGHVKFLKGDKPGARDCYERTLSFVNDASETHSLYLRLASIYLHENKYQEAKKIYLMACKKNPSCVTWLGVGTACYRLGELSEAEDALSEANMLNNLDPEVWAYLSLVCLKTNRCHQAEQAYKYAIKLKLEEGPLLAEIHGEQARYGFGNPSF
ncbi:unnamed protein product [Candidula unifasciata]|uniref:C2 domain-containing protein n=1 Tax=Candidula unifasciata TaxID=100452 RepID=A0A8S3ZZJ3_9EUPU|nr:unnamed protein product [Candidula unifasciata]